MRIIFDIDTDNAAFDDNPDEEISRLIHQVATKCHLAGANGGRLVDFNGNTCGEWRVQE